jgi:transposase-like protein
LAVAINLTDPIFTDERKAREHMEAVRWPDGVTCPHCGNLNSARIYRIAPNAKAKIRDGLFECQDCHGQFTVQTGTVMESSHVPLNKWVLAYRLMASAKKGISAHQMHRTIGVTYKTAWFMCHRIRESMRDVSGDKLGGPGIVVESDETFVGGKPRRYAHTDPKTGKRASKKYPKTGVHVLVERDGRRRSRAILLPDPMEGAIKINLGANLAKGTHLQTDQHKAYMGLDKALPDHKLIHSSVDHGRGEYARDGVHSNTAESWNALLKRSIIGSFHHVSAEHLSRYCDEVSFRWDRRGMDDTERTDAAIKGAEGKRLTYRNPSSAPQA